MTAWRRSVRLVLSVGMLLFAGSAAAQSNIGTDFWLAETTNLDCRNDFVIAIANPNAGPAAIDITHQGSATVTSASIPSGGLQTFPFPCRHSTATGLLGKNMVYRVQSDVDVAVYMFNWLVNEFTNDASLVLPVETLGKRYRVGSYSERDGSMFGVVAIEDSTTVRTYPPGSAVPTDTVTLQQGEYFQRRMAGTADLTGWLIETDKKAAAFSGHECTFLLGFACDHLEEQLVPEESLADTYVACPTLSRPVGCNRTIPNACAVDVFRYVATEDNTTISVGSPDCTGGTINAGQFIQCNTDVPHLVSADKPFYAYQYLIAQEGTNPPNPIPDIGDPAMVNMVPVEQFQFNYIFLVPNTYAYDFINIVQPVGTNLTMNGAPIAEPCDSVGMIGGVEYCCFAKTIPDGAHKIAGTQPFGLVVSGFDQFASYAYPGGQGLQPLNAGCDTGGPYQIESCDPVTINLDGDATCSDMSPPVSTVWTSIDGVTFGDPSQVDTTATTPGGVGVYEVCLEVTCAGLDPVQCCSVINVVEPPLGCGLNNPPVCFAGADKDQQCGAVSLIDATASDPDLDPLTYSWTSTCADASYDPNATSLNPTVTLATTCARSCEFTLTVDDGQGGTCSDTVLVEIDDDTAPVVDPLPTVNVQCIEDVPAVNTAIVTYTENCPAPATVSHVGDVSDALSCPETIARTYRVTDGCGNTADVTQTIVVNDTTPPVVDPLAVVNVQCIEDVPVANTAIVTYTDNCAAPSTVSHVGDVSDGLSCPQTIARTYRVTDGCGNATDVAQVIVVDDTLPPVVDPLPSVTVECIDEVPGANTAIVTYSDNCVAPSTVSHVGDVSDGLSCPETLTRTYRVTDGCGNATDVTQTIVVDDTIPPLVGVLLEPAPPLVVSSAGPPAPPGSVCSPRSSGLFRVVCEGPSDNCDPNPDLVTKLIVTHHEVPVPGTCVEVVEEIEVACDEWVELRLAPAVCPSQPHSGGPPVTVNSNGVRVITGEQIVLQATATDACDNSTTVTWDPAAEPSPTCEEVLIDLTCCPAIGWPEPTPCGVEVCGPARPWTQPRPGT